MATLEINNSSATPLSEESHESDVQVPQGHDPYEPPASELLEAEEISETDELKAYVGEKADYYLHQWRNPLYIFNWGAFFFTGAWMVYRKMYWQFLAVMGATVVVSLILQTLGISQAWIPSLALGLVCGYFGSKWYHYHALRVIRKTRLKKPRADERLKLLAKRGGTNTTFVIAVIVIAVIVIAFQLPRLVAS